MELGYEVKGQGREGRDGSNCSNGWSGKQELGRKEGEGECTTLYQTHHTEHCRRADSKEEEGGWRDILMSVGSWHHQLPGTKITDGGSVDDDDNDVVDDDDTISSLAPRSTQLSSSSLAGDEDFSYRIWIYDDTIHGDDL